MSDQKARLLEQVKEERHKLGPPEPVRLIDLLDEHEPTLDAEASIAGALYAIEQAGRTAPKVGHSRPGDPT